MMNKITVAYLRDLEKQVSLGEISYSRMVELLNEKVGGESSPVSQQLTRERLKTLLVDLVDRVTGADELTVMDIQDIDSTVNDICHLSVSPDAQKEIECKCTSESEASDCSINCDYSNNRGELLDIDTYEGAKKYLESEGLDVDKIAAEGMVFIKTVKENLELKKQLTSKESEISELQESAISITQKMEFYKTGCDNFNKEMIELQTKLASKESDVKRAVEALEKSEYYLTWYLNRYKDSLDNPFGIDELIEEISSLKGNK